MAPKANKKKSGQDSIGSKLQLVMKSGKYTLGYKTTLKAIRSGKAKLVILANNLPALRMSEIQYYAMLSRTGVHHFTGELRTDLGSDGGGDDVVIARRFYAETRAYCAQYCFAFLFRGHCAPPRYT